MALQKSVQPVQQVQYPCSQNGRFFIFPNVNIFGKTNGDAGEPHALKASTSNVVALLGPKEKFIPLFAGDKGSTDLQSIFPTHFGKTLEIPVLLEDNPARFS